jgi:hypothetical protein
VHAGGDVRYMTDKETVAEVSETPNRRVESTDLIWLVLFCCKHYLQSNSAPQLQLRHELRRQDVRLLLIHPLAVEIDTRVAGTPSFSF